MSKSCRRRRYTDPPLSPYCLIPSRRSQEKKRQSDFHFLIFTALIDKPSASRRCQFRLWKWKKKEENGSLYCANSPGRHTHTPVCAFFKGTFNNRLTNRRQPEANPKRVERENSNWTVLVIDRFVNSSSRSSAVLLKNAKQLMVCTGAIGHKRRGLNTHRKRRESCLYRQRSIISSHCRPSRDSWNRRGCFKGFFFLQWQSQTFKKYSFFSSSSSVCVVWWKGVAVHSARTPCWAYKLRSSFSEKRSRKFWCDDDNNKLFLWQERRRRRRRAIYIYIV